jgi:hypothetical protein
MANGASPIAYLFGNNLSRMYREVGVRRTPRGLRQIALSISFLSPIAKLPDAFRQEYGVTHFPARPTIFCFHFFPKRHSSEL